MGIFELNLTMPEDFLLLAIIPSELYVFGHIFGRSKSYRKALPSRCSSQLELSGTLSPISWLFYSGGGEKIHFQAQSACSAQKGSVLDPPVLREQCVAAYPTRKVLLVVK